MLRGSWKNTDNMASFIDENISKGYIFNSSDNAFSHADNQKIIICQVPRIDISSTMVREQIKKQVSVSGLVPEPVEQMIRTKELYQ